MTKPSAIAADVGPGPSQGRDQPPAPPVTRLPGRDRLHLAIRATSMIRCGICFFAEEEDGGREDFLARPRQRIQPDNPRPWSPVCRPTTAWCRIPIGAKDGSLDDFANSSRQGADHRRPAQDQRDPRAKVAEQRRTAYPISNGAAPRPGPTPKPSSAATSGDHRLRRRGSRGRRRESPSCAPNCPGVTSTTSESTSAQTA